MRLTLFLHHFHSSHEDNVLGQPTFNVFNVTYSIKTLNKNKALRETWWDYIYLSIFCNSFTWKCWGMDGFFVIRCWSLDLKVYPIHHESCVSNLQLEQNDFNFLACLTWLNWANPIFGISSFGCVDIDIKMLKITKQATAAK